MRFEYIALAAGAADAPDPRSTPATVPATHIKETPATVTGTDRNPSSVHLTLEGTAGQTVTVQQFALDETQNDPRFADDPNQGAGARRFYSLGSTQVVTVGAIATLTALPGKVYYRTTSAPVAASVLKIGFS